MAGELFQVLGVLLFVQKGQHRRKGGLNVAYQSQVQAGAPPEILAPTINLDNGRFFRIELRVGKVGA